MWDWRSSIGSWFQGYAAAIGWIGAMVVLVVVGVTVLGVPRSGRVGERHGYTGSRTAFRRGHSVRVEARERRQPKPLTMGTVIRHVVLMASSW